MTVASGAGRRTASLRSVVGYVLVCFLAAAALQPLWPRAAERYTAVLAAASRPVLLWLQPTRLVGGLSHRGTIVQVESARSPGAPIGSFETGHFTFYLPFIVLLLAAARWRLHLVSVPEIVLILGFLFAVQVSCVSFFALRLVAFDPATGGGYGIIGPLEYVLLHTLYHTYGNFGPQLWNGLIVGLVLFRSARRPESPPAPTGGVAMHHALAMACGVLILPSFAYIVAAPALRHLTGQVTLARRATAAAYLHEGDPEVAGRLARALLDEDANDLEAMMILGALAEGGNPGEARGWYAKVVAREPGHLAARLGLARAESQLGDLDAAVSQLYAVLGLAPDRAEAYEGLGDIYMQRGEYAAGRKHYEIAAGLRPDQRGLKEKLEKAGELAGEAPIVAVSDVR